MAPLILELTQLEVEPLEVLAHPQESEQDRGLDTLSIAQSDENVAAPLTGTFIFHFGDKLCCCCPCCCACCLCC